MFQVIRPDSCFRKLPGISDPQNCDCDIFSRENNICPFLLYLKNGYRCPWLHLSNFFSFTFSLLKSLIKFSQNFRFHRPQLENYTQAFLYCQSISMQSRTSPILSSTAVQGYWTNVFTGVLYPSIQAVLPPSIPVVFHLYSSFTIFIFHSHKTSSCSVGRQKKNPSGNRGG